MARQLRPRRQGIPADHNYFAPYPNTIYTSSPPTIQRSTDMDQSEDNSLEHPPRKKRKAAIPKDIQMTTCDTVKHKKRWRYFGYRRKRRGYPKPSVVKGDDQVVDAEGKRKKTNWISLKPTLIAEAGDHGVQAEGLLAGEESGVSNSEETPVHKCKCCRRWRLSRKDRRQSQRLVIKNFKLPFDKLPDLCKLKIFSFLSVTERGRMAEVCQEWRRLIWQSGLWCHIDFNVFNPIHCHNSSTRGLSPSQYPWFMTVTEYNKHCLRVQKYMAFLQSVVPHVRFLRFAYDIVNPKDEWLKHLLNFLEHSNCKMLQALDMDWTLTPVRPPCADRFCCFFNKARTALQRHVRRVLALHELLNKLTRAAPMVTQLSLPFDWSERSILLLCRWKHVEKLSLGSYVQLRLLQQEPLSLLLGKLTQLQELRLTICSPILENQKNMYTFTHPKLKTLDTRECQGVFIKSLKTPYLVVLNTPMIPWLGLVGRRRFYPPCLYSVLRKGAPRLEWFNNHRLHNYWREFSYGELEVLLNQTCPCKTHSTRPPRDARDEHGHGEDDQN